MKWRVQAGIKWPEEEKRKPMRGRRKSQGDRSMHPGNYWWVGEPNWRWHLQCERESDYATTCNKYHSLSNFLLHVSLPGTPNPARQGKGEAQDINTLIHITTTCLLVGQTQGSSGARLRSWISQSWHDYWLLGFSRPSYANMHGRHTHDP